MNGSVVDSKVARAAASGAAPRLPWRGSLAVFAWGTAFVAVSVGMWLHTAAPGAPAEAPPQWPAASALAPGARPTLLVFAHPACACTKATLAELARLLDEVGDRVEAHVLFETWPGMTPAVEESEAWRLAARIPGVSVRRDPERREAALFGARTSGQLLLYDTAGALRFAGGITPGRGEEGDSVGREGLAQVLARTAHDARAPVYGCSLTSTNAPEIARASRPAR